MALVAIASLALSLVLGGLGSPGTVLYLCLLVVQFLVKRKDI